MIARPVAALGLCLALSGFPAFAYEPPAFPLTDAQTVALDEYASAKGAKAFAAGPGGQFSAQTGFVSASVAAREALKACDEDIAAPDQRCILIDLNGTPVPYALQLAQTSRADPSRLQKPVDLRDLELDAGTRRAVEDLKSKSAHTAFALSLRGSWARAWEAADAAEARTQALAECNKKERAKIAPCFILSTDGEAFDGGKFDAASDLSVARQQP
jgi:hypothetical protein